MRHLRSGVKLQRTSTERRALVRGLVRALFLHQRIVTTHKKAKYTQPFAEKLITTAKVNSIHSRRQVNAWLNDRTVTKHLFDEIAPLFKDRQGGYTRVLKTDWRKGDNAQMSILELVSKTSEYEKQVQAKAERLAAPKSGTGADSGKKGHAHGDSADAKASGESHETKGAADPHKHEKDAKDKKPVGPKKSFVQNLQKIFRTRRGQEGK